MRDFKEFFEEWEKSNKVIDKDSCLEYSSKTGRPPAKRRDNLSFELDLHGFTKNEALKRLEMFIDKVRCSNVVKVKIIHGVGRHSAGKRVLKEAVKAWLDEHPLLVRNYRPGQIGEGSSGVTVAYIKAK